MMDWGTAVMLGLAGSLHCLGMCGPLAVALPKPKGGAGMLLAGRLFYNLGRVVTYAAIGAIGGLIGKPIQFAGFQQAVSILMGVGVLFFAFPHLGRFRNAKLQIVILRFVDRLKAVFAKQLPKKSLGSMWVLGLLNGLLPCGLVYFALAGAVLTGGALKGAGFMAVFGLGTLPMMFAVSMVGMSVRQKIPAQVKRVVPLLFLLIGSLLILRGLSLGIPIISPDLTAEGGCCH